MKFSAMWKDCGSSAAGPAKEKRRQEEKTKRKTKKGRQRNMRKGKIRIKCMGKAAAAIFVTVLSLSACTMPFTKAWPFSKSTPIAGANEQSGNKSGEDSQKPGRVDTGFVVPGPESFDSADTAILVGRDREENTVTLRNLEIGKNYTLSMDGTTRLYDRYGDAVSMDQIEKGD